MLRLWTSGSLGKQLQNAIPRGGEVRLLCLWPTRSYGQHVQVKTSVWCVLPGEERHFITSALSRKVCQRVNLLHGCEFYILNLLRLLLRLLRGEGVEFFFLIDFLFCHNLSFVPKIL